MPDWCKVFLLVCALCFGNAQAYSLLEHDAEGNVFLSSFEEYSSSQRSERFLVYQETSSAIDPIFSHYGSNLGNMKVTKTSVSNDIDEAAAFIHFSPSSILFHKFGLDFELKDELVYLPVTKEEKQIVENTNQLNREFSFVSMHTGLSCDSYVAKNKLSFGLCVPIHQLAKITTRDSPCCDLGFSPAIGYSDCTCTGPFIANGDRISFGGNITAQSITIIADEISFAVDGLATGMNAAEDISITANTVELCGIYTALNIVLPPAFDICVSMLVVVSEHVELTNINQGNLEVIANSITASGPVC